MLLLLLMKPPRRAARDFTVSRMREDSGVQSGWLSETSRWNLEVPDDVNGAGIWSCPDHKHGKLGGRRRQDTDGQAIFAVAPGLRAGLMMGLLRCCIVGSPPAFLITHTPDIQGLRGQQPYRGMCVCVCVCLYAAFLACIVHACPPPARVCRNRRWDVVVGGVRVGPSRSTFATSAVCAQTSQEDVHSLFPYAIMTRYCMNFSHTVHLNDPGCRRRRSFDIGNLSAYNVHGFPRS